MILSAFSAQIVNISLTRQRRKKRRKKYLDGKEKEYDDVFPPFSFDSESKYFYHGAKIGNELWWIVEELKL